MPCQITFENSDETFTVNKEILKVYSSLFKNYFDDPEIMSIELKETSVSPESFGIIVKWIEGNISGEKYTLEATKSFKDLLFSAVFLLMNDCFMEQLLTHLVNRSDELENLSIIESFSETQLFSPNL